MRATDGRRGIRGAVTAFLVAASVATAAPPTGSSWEISLEGGVGVPQGAVQVRENEIEGTRLDLRHDLGVRTWESLGLEAVRRFGAASDLRLSFGALFLGGSTTLPSDVFFNGCTLQGGTSLDTRPLFLRVNALYERTVASLAGGGRVDAGGGFTYVFLDFRLQGTLAATTKGTETSEDFLTQELPVPLLTVRIEMPVGPTLSLTGVATGGWLPSINSLRSEGGVVKIAQGHLDLSFGVREHLGETFHVEAAVVGSYFTQHEVSREDDNDIRLLRAGVRLALGATF